MSSAAVLIEYARASSIVLWYSREPDGLVLWTWAPTYARKSRRKIIAKLLQRRYFEVIALLKLATLETNS